MIGFRLGGIQAFRPQHQLRRELLVFVQRTLREAQAVQDGSLEEIAAYAAVQVVVGHVFRSAHWAFRLGQRNRLFGTCRTEDHHVGFLVPDDVKALFVGVCHQEVVGIDKLDESAFGQFHASVACPAQSPVGLANIDDVVCECDQIVDGREVRAVVHDDDLPFRFVQT